MPSARHLTILFTAIASLASFTTGCSSTVQGTGEEQPVTPASSSGGPAQSPGAGTGPITCTPFTANGSCLDLQISG